VEELSFDGLLAVCAVAFVAPLALGFAPRLRIPAVVLEIVGGIVIGPSVLGWVEVDAAIEVLALAGLAFLLFLAGLEIDIRRLRGGLLRNAGVAFALSFVLALIAGVALDAGGLADTPLLVAIILVSTSLGIVVPVLQDAHEASSRFGQLVIGAASVADFAAVLLLSLFFSREATGTDTKLMLIGTFALLIAVVAVAVMRAERSMGISRVLLRLQDTTAQIRIRGAFLLLIAFVALAESFGLEVILGAFAAGVILGGIDRDEMDTHPQFHLKLQAVGFGVFIPVFFVSSGLRFDLGAVFESASSIASVPVFLLCLLAVRGLPVLLYRELDRRRKLVAALLQATSLPFIVAATQIGLDLDLLDPETSSSLVFAGLLSVVAFPAAALALLTADPNTKGGAPCPMTPATPT
jgi:Kef-type K+ transport system membrane component KefB